MIIDTERLSIRHMRESDEDAVHAYASDPEVCRYTDFGPNTWEDTVEFVNAAVAHPAQSFADLGITLRGRDQIVGGLGAFVPKGEDADERPHVREVGWVLRRDLWGQGLMPEAVGAMLRQLRDDLTVTRVEARCRPENKASVRVMEKLGMSFEFFLARDYECKGVWVDSHLYGLNLQSAPALAT